MVDLSAMSGGPMRVDLRRHRLIPDDSPPPAQRHENEAGRVPRRKEKSRRR